MTVPSSALGLCSPCPLLVLAALMLFQPLATAATILDFEGFSDSTILDTQYPGLTFSNTIILTAGISLNEFELPPHSGTNVAFDNNGPISIVFDTPVLSFGGFFTYAELLTLAAFDASSGQVDSATSAFSNNLALSGDLDSTPNEFLSVSFPSGISSLIITGDPAGGTLSMDDATITSAAPEPRTGLLTLLVAAFVAGAIRQRRFDH
jgi:hypothetical protein